MLVKKFIMAKPLCHIGNKPISKIQSTIVRSQTTLKESEVMGIPDNHYVIHCNKTEQKSKDLLNSTLDFYDL